MATDKTKQLNIRIEPEIDAQLKQFENETDMNASALVRTLLRAVITQFAEEKTIRLPIKLVGKDTIDLSGLPISHQQQMRQLFSELSES